MVTVTLSQCLAETGRKTIRGRCVDIRKEDDICHHNDRSRYVAQEVRQTYGGTSLEGCDGRDEEQEAMFMDISKVYPPLGCHGQRALPKRHLSAHERWRNVGREETWTLETIQFTRSAQVYAYSSTEMTLSLVDTNMSCTGCRRRPERGIRRRLGGLLGLERENEMAILTHNTRPCSLEHSVYVDTGWGVFVVVCVCVVPLSRFQRLSGVGVVLTSLALDWCSRMVSDGFQTQKMSSWILVKERAERVMASAISIDGRKEWTCKFCSDVWTRWRCRRCYVTMTSEQVCVGGTGRRSPQ